MAHATRITRPRLIAVTPAADYCLNVSFVDGSCGTVNMKDFIFSLSGLIPLRDPAVFSGVVLGEYGWEAEWPLLDIQIGADTLFADMLDQRSETPADRFTVWRIRNNLSLSAASRELGVTIRTISAYGSGARPIPRTVQLACLGWETEQHRKTA
ncbi:MAG: DUF2442 domain-containing protein [Desulfuromonadaceae bacterium]|nr:DUF2442 domain-containing protein [Desulfuromonadaceae bacterium]MDD2856310.1 DUF2442 domain-containing protein [Desulfuromonadaceae bacterium]